MMTKKTEIRIHTFHSSKRRREKTNSDWMYALRAAHSARSSHLLLFLSLILSPSYLHSSSVPFLSSLFPSATLSLSLPHCVLHTLCFIWFYICIRIDTVCFLLCCRVLNVVAFHIVWASGTREQFTHLSNQQSWVEKKTKIFSHRSTLHGYASVRWMETNGS